MGFSNPKLVTAVRSHSDKFKEDHDRVVGVGGGCFFGFPDITAVRVFDIMVIRVLVQPLEIARSALVCMRQKLILVGNFFLSKDPSTLVQPPLSTFHERRAESSQTTASQHTIIHTYILTLMPCPSSHLPRTPTQKTPWHPDQAPAPSAQ